MLAGGSSRRMGRDKALLDAGDGRSLVERSIEVLATAFDDLVISVGAAGPSRDLESAVQRSERRTGRLPRFALDGDADAGPVAGVIAALDVVRAPIAFVLGVDYPEISLSFARCLVELASAPPTRGCVPRYAGRLEPAYAAYARGLVPELRALGAPGSVRLVDLAELDGVRVVDVEKIPLAAAPEWDAVFRSLNSPGDYARWRGGEDSRPSCR